MASLRSEQGFTLIEVLIALLMVSALVAGAMALMARTGTVVRSARLSTAALLLASQKVETLRASPAGSSGGSAEDYVAADGTLVPRDRALFVRRWTVITGWGSGGAATVVVEILTGAGDRILSVQAVLPSAQSWDGAAP